MNNIRKQMKILYLLPLYFILFSCIHHTEEKDPLLETATQKLEGDSTVTFTIKKFEPSKYHPLAKTPFIYQDKLWGVSAKTQNIQSILLSGTLDLDGQVIDLDTSGIVNPWEDSNEFKAFQARLIKNGADGSDVADIYFDFFYTLEVAFINEEDGHILVTWTIYKNKSIRDSIKELRRSYPQWICFK